MPNLAIDYGAETSLISNDITFSCEVEQAQNNTISNKSPVNAQPLQDVGYSQSVLINDMGEVKSYTRLDITINRIVIDKGTFLAKNPNSINRDWNIGGLTGNELLDRHVQPFFEFISAKRIDKSKVQMLDCVLANLLSAYNTSSQLLYSRDNSSGGVRAMKQIVSYLETSEMIVNVIGKANEYQGNSSWMIPTDKLKNEFELSRVKVALNKDASMVIVRDKDGNEKQLSRIKTRQPLKLKQASNPAQDYNRVWLEHDVTLGGRYLVPFCRRIFNESLDYGGRFYGASHLTLPKAQREQLLIDGEVTVEPDFKAMHFTLLYAQVGIELNPVIDDPYLIDGFDRQTAKLASLVLLNSEDIGRFKANITKSGNPKNKGVMEAYKADMELFIKRSSQGLPTEQPRKPAIAKGFIWGMPDDIKGGDLLDSICKRHEPIAHLFGAEKIGVSLQNVDSNIMAKTIQQLTALDIPTLPVHDSLRCRESDCDTVINAMKLAYKAVTGFKGCVTLD